MRALENVDFSGNVEIVGLGGQARPHQPIGGL
jgi:hypothetical protein